MEDHPSFRERGAPYKSHRSPFSGADLEQLEFVLLHAANYNAARERYFRSANQRANFAIVAGGLGAVTALMGGLTFLTGLVNAALAVLGVLQVTCNFGDRANLHSKLRAKYLDDLATVRAKKLKKDSNDLWFAEMIRSLHTSWGEEPPSMHIVDAVAHNNTVMELYIDYDERDLIYVSGWQKFTRHVRGGEPLHLRSKRRLEEARNKQWAAIMHALRLPAKHFVKP